MHRLTIALLAALDAAIAAAVGLAVLLAPLTLLWVLAFGLSAEWGSLWPISASLWQFGHAVPVQVVIPDDVLLAVGIPEEGARFALSLPPLAIGLFTVLFAARSGKRAAVANDGIAGVAGGALVFTAISVAVALTGRSGELRTTLWLAIVLPAAAYLAGLLIGAVRYAWAEGDGGIVDRVHDIVDGWGDWSPVPAEALRGSAVVVVALMGAGAVAVVVSVFARAGDVIALFQAARVDALGAFMLTLVHLAYLPTMIIWAVSWLAGPGFAVGTGTAVSPAGTELGVVPGLPALGLLPENAAPWMLVSILVPVGAGALAGWMVRSRLVWEGLGEPLWPRAAIAGGIGLLSAGVAALAAVLTSGSIGPGRLAEVGPHAGGLALAIGLEVLIGAAILLLTPRHRDELAEERTDRWLAEMRASETPVD